MHINGVEIEDTYAEAFHMTAARIIITAHNAHWAQIAAWSTVGFATSMVKLLPRDVPFELAVFPKYLMIVIWGGVAWDRFGSAL